MVKYVLGKLKGLSIAQISIEEKDKANRLAYLALSPEVDLWGISLEYLPEPSFAQQEGMEIYEVDSGPGWMEPINIFLSMGELPTDKAEVRRIRYKASTHYRLTTSFTKLTRGPTGATSKVELYPKELSSKDTFGRLWPRTPGTL